MKTVVKIKFPRGRFLLRMFLRTRRLHFWQTCRKSLPDDKIKVVFFREKKFPGNVPMDMQISILTSTSKRFPIKRQKKFGLMSEVDKMKIFPKETFLLEIFLWARKRLFGHSCPKRFDKVWYFTVQCPTMIKKHCFFKKTCFS